MNGASEERIEYDVFALAEIQTAKYQALADRVSTKLSEFECSRSSHLQDFARSKVTRWEAHGHSRTYVVITPVNGDDIAVPAFFTVGMTALDLTAATGSMRKKLTGDISLTKTGAYSIAELARADDYTTSQLPGHVILGEALEVIRRARRYVAGRFVVVDSRREVFEKLYGPAGFRVVNVTEAPRGMADKEDADFVTSCCLVKD